MRILDDKFKKHRKKYILQSLIAMFVMIILGIFLDMFLQTTLLASIGATVFIIFTMPHTKRSRPRYVLGGYTVGMGVGYLCYVVLDPSFIFVESMLVALAVGLSIFIMVTTNTEHPPAAAVAMGTVISGIDLYTVVIVYLCLILILVAKQLLSKWLIDLL